MKNLTNTHITKKHKGLKKSTHRMDFDSDSERLADLSEFSKEFFKKPKKIEQKKFQIMTLCKWNLLVKYNLVD